MLSLPFYLSLFHNSNVFGSCVIHILYTECAKLKKNSGPERLMLSLSLYLSLFHNSNAFVSCIIHIIYTGVLKLKK